MAGRDRGGARGAGARGMGMVPRMQVRPTHFQAPRGGAQPVGGGRGRVLFRATGTGRQGGRTPNLGRAGTKEDGEGYVQEWEQTGVTNKQTNGGTSGIVLLVLVARRQQVQAKQRGGFSLPARCCTACCVGLAVGGLSMVRGRWTQLTGRTPCQQRPPLAPASQPLAPARQCQLLCGSGAYRAAPSPPGPPPHG